MSYLLEPNLHGIQLGDIFLFQYQGVTIFVRVVDTGKNFVKAIELETYKYKVTHRIFDKYRKKHPDEVISETGWAEMLGRNLCRPRKPENCYLLNRFQTNTKTKPTLVFRTSYSLEKMKPVLMIPVTQKIPLYWRVERPRVTYVYAEPFIDRNDKASVVRQARFTFFPCAAPERKTQEILKAD